MTETTFVAVTCNLFAYRDREGSPNKIFFCGFGEPLLHPEAAIWAGAMTMAGMEVGIITNGLLLNDEMAARLMIANVKPICVSFDVGDMDPKKTKRIIRLKSKLNGRLQVSLTVCKNEVKALPVVEDLWRQMDIPIWTVNRCHNRGGHLNKPDLDFGSLPGLEGRRCWVYDSLDCIDWQGKVHSCCQDLAGEAVIGDATSEPWGDILKKKDEIAQKPLPWKICEKCNDPNRLSQDTRILVAR